MWQNNIVVHPWTQYLLPLVLLKVSTFSSLSIGAQLCNLTPPLKSTTQTSNSTSKDLFTTLPLAVMSTLLWYPEAPSRYHPCIVKCSTWHHTIKSSSTLEDKPHTTRLPLRYVLSLHKLRRPCSKGYTDAKAGWWVWSDWPGRLSRPHRW